MILMFIPIGIIVDLSEKIDNILEHKAPYYSMKVGAFETRIDVEPLLAAFKKDFPYAIPFRDKVMKIELLSDVSEQ